MSDQIALFPVVEFSVHMRRWWVKMSGAVTVNNSILTKLNHFWNTTNPSLSRNYINDWKNKTTYFKTFTPASALVFSFWPQPISICFPTGMLKQHLTPEWCSNRLMSLGSGTTTSCTQTVSRICSTLWLKLQSKSLKHLMQPGIIYNYLSILKAEQLALIEGKRIMGSSWHSVHLWLGACKYPFQRCHNTA